MSYDETNLDLRLEDAIDRCVGYLDSFWDPGRCCFVRDTSAMKRESQPTGNPDTEAGAGQAYPSATFACVVALHEANLARASSVEPAQATGEPYNYRRYLEHLDPSPYQYEPLLRGDAFNQSRLLQSRPNVQNLRGKDREALKPNEQRQLRLFFAWTRWRAILAAWSLRAHVALYQTLLRQGRHDIQDVAMLDDLKHRLRRSALPCVHLIRIELLCQVHREDAEGLEVLVFEAVQALQRAKRAGLLQTLFSVGDTDEDLNDHYALWDAMKKEEIEDSQRIPSRITSARDLANHLAGLRTRLRQVVEQQVHRLLVVHRHASPALGSLIGMSFFGSVLFTLDRDVYRPLATRIVDIVLAGISRGDAWSISRYPTTMPSGQSYFITVFQVGAVLAELAFSISRRQDPPDEEMEQRARFLSGLLTSVEDSVSVVDIGSDDHTARRLIRGWGNEHIYVHDQVQSWVTAFVLAFLTHLRRYTQQCIQRRVLHDKSYDVIWPQHMRWDTLDTLADNDKDEPSLFADVRDHFVGARVTSGMPVVRDRFAANVSLLLFGPPGTAKTLTVRALAKTLRWPLLTLTPATFLRGGQQSIDAQATLVFNDLLALQDVVILFDECDELFRKRPQPAATEIAVRELAAALRPVLESSILQLDGPPKEKLLDAIVRKWLAERYSDQLSQAALITGAMLPRLKNLHDRGKLIFVVATNRLHAIDNAIRRPGRFDRRYAVGPPSAITRAWLLAKEISDELFAWPKKAPSGENKRREYKFKKLKKIIGEDELGGLTWEELRVLADRLNAEKEPAHIGTKSALSDFAAIAITESSRVIGRQEMEQFKQDSAYSDFKATGGV